MTEQTPFTRRLTSGPTELVVVGNLSRGYVLCETVGDSRTPVRVPLRDVPEHNRQFISDARTV